MTIKPEWIKSPKGPWVNKWENDYKPEGVDLNKIDENDKILKLYTSICSLIYCLQFINPYDSYKKQLKELFLKYPEADLYHMGFPEDWNEQDLWQ